MRFIILFLRKIPKIKQVCTMMIADNAIETGTDLYVVFLVAENVVNTDIFNNMHRV